MGGEWREDEEDVHTFGMSCFGSQLLVAVLQLLDACNIG